MDKIYKKILSISLIFVFSMTSFSQALETPIRSYSNSEVVSEFLGELDSKISNYERQRISALVRSWKNLYESRISAKKAEPSIREAQAMKELTKKLDEYTVKYYFDGKYEVNQNYGDYHNYVIQNIKHVIALSDYNRLYILCEKYERDYSITDEQVQKIVDEISMILRKYSSLNSEQLLSHILDGSENLLAVYSINESRLEYDEIPYVTLEYKDVRIKKDFPDVWREILSIIPYEYFHGFDEFMLTSDGEMNNLGYVRNNDSTGSRWSISIDPEDISDKDLFYETIIHEYFHYVTLNETQVSYLDVPNVYTYYDHEVVTNIDSYLNAFSMRFWDLLKYENKFTQDSYLFYMRHNPDFVSRYASTDPAEDICESFTAFVLSEKPVDNSEIGRKISFFYEYPEFVELRQIIRSNIINFAEAEEKAA